MSITRLKSTISNRGGLAKTNRFEIVFARAGRGIFSNDDISFLCESCSIPGKQIQTNDYSTVKKSEKIPFTYFVEDVNLVFHLTNDYYVKRVFDSWLEDIINSKNYTALYYPDFVSDVKIYQLDNYDRRVYGIILKNAYPTSVNSIDLNNTSENSTQRLNVTLTYEDYEILNLYNVFKAINDVLNLGKSFANLFKKNKIKISSPPKPSKIVPSPPPEQLNNVTIEVKSPVVLNAAKSSTILNTDSGSNKIVSNTTEEKIIKSNNVVSSSSNAIVKSVRTVSLASSGGTSTGSGGTTTGGSKQFNDLTKFDVL